MAIFRPGKDGDVMGKEVQGRFNKHQRREFAITKQLEEERIENESYYKRQRMSKSFNAVVDKQLRDAGFYPKH